MQTTIGDIFTDAQLKVALSIVVENDGAPGLNQKLIDGVVREAMPRVNQVTGQENDEAYIAYLLQYALHSACIR